MKRLLAVVVGLVLCVSCCAAEGFDLSGLSYSELQSLAVAVRDEMASRTEFSENVIAESVSDGAVYQVFNLSRKQDGDRDLLVVSFRFYNGSGKVRRPQSALYLDVMQNGRMLDYVMTGAGLNISDPWVDTDPETDMTINIAYILQDDSEVSFEMHGNDSGRVNWSVLPDDLPAFE